MSVLSSENSGQKRNRPSLRRGGIVLQRSLRGEADVRRLEPLGPLFDVELNLIAFIQCFIPGADDRPEMDEHVFATRALNETEAFGSVEPLDCSFFHGTCPFFCEPIRNRRTRSVLTGAPLETKTQLRKTSQLRSLVFSLGCVSDNSSEPIPHERDFKARQRCTVLATNHNTEFRVQTQHKTGKFPSPPGMGMKGSNRGCSNSIFSCFPRPERHMEICAKNHP